MAEIEFTLTKKSAENLLIHRRRLGLPQEELGFLTDLHRTPSQRRRVSTT